MIKEILSNKRLWIILLISSAFTIFLTYPFPTTQFNPSTYASEPKDIDQAQLSGHCELNGSAAFLLTDETTNYPGTVVVACSARIKVPNQTVLQVDMRVNWSSQDLTLDSIRYPSGMTGNTNSQGAGTIYFSVDVPDQTYPNMTTVAKLWFSLSCFSSTDVTFANFCTESKIHSGSPVHFYYPISVSSGTITRIPPPHTMKPLGDSATVNDTFWMPVLYSCTTAASAGFGSSWEYPRDSLDFIDVKKGPIITANPTGSANESTDPAKLYISYNNLVPRNDVSDTIFYIRFKNTMHAHNKQAKVVRLTDTLKFCDGPNTDVLGIITNRDSAYAVSYYDAQFRFKDTSAVINTPDVPFRTQLKNNFVVQLKTFSDISRFKIDDTLWTLITHDGWSNSDNDYAWVLDPPSGATVNEKFKNDTGSPKNIPKRPNLTPVVNHNVDVLGTTGTQNANVRDDGYTKLKDSASTITATPGNGITLTTGTFTVTSGGGGCPFVYTWDGNQFLEDNTILTTSEFNLSGTSVTDYYKLTQPLVENNGEYLLQLREFENEESFIDQLELITIDHPQGVKVGVSPEGKIIAYDQALFPVGCVDQEGKDQLDKILSKDELFFESDGPGYLVLTFNHPSKKELLNDIRPEGAPDSGNGGDGPPKRIGVNTKVTLEIEDSDGQWHNLGVVAPRANVQNAFWILGTTNIPLGEQFRVKLSWDRVYSVDRLAYYVPTDQQWQQESLKLTQAAHSKKMDVTSLVSAYDGLSAKLIPSEAINLSFPVGKPVPDGMVRDFIFKSVGYYIPYDRASAAGPFTYKLHNNYPNPFNAQTEIQYALPEPSEVNLSVYNIMGQKVRTLVEGRLSAGVHRVIWDGKNERGETVASGVYFYSIKAGTYIETKKMTLLK